MSLITSRQKTHEFRRTRIPPQTKRVWFYLNAPSSQITHICEIDPARTRTPADAPLPEDGIGNREFNMFHKDWNGLDYAYKIRSVWELHIPLTLQVLKQKFGMKGAPRALMYVPTTILDTVPLEMQRCVWTVEEQRRVVATVLALPIEKTRNLKRKLTEEDVMEIEPQVVKRRRSLRLASRGLILKEPSCDAMDVD